jgi:hypothetical protein
MKKFPGSIVTFVCLVGYLAIAKLVITYVFDESIFPHPSQKGVFGWHFIGIVGVFGLLGVCLAHLTRFPEMWDERVTQRQRWMLPALIGLAFGLEEILFDYATGASKLVVEQLQIPFFHVRFPASLLVYPGGAIIVETLYRLFPIPFLLFLISNVALRGKGQERTFWVLAILLSWIEPVTQSGILSLALGRETVFRGREGLVAYMMVEGYLLNCVQAWLFRKYGFLASLTLRVSMYVVWHVLWGLATQDLNGYSSN